MDAKPLLVEISRRMLEVGLEAVLIGNAAAALQGAPVTTVDFDFFFRKTPRNMTKVKALARALHATVLRPYYPVSDWYRVVRDDDGLQVDLMATAHGLRSFEGVRARASILSIGGVPIAVASLGDIIKSKRAAGRPRDKAVLEILEKAHAEAASAARRAQSPEGRECAGPARADSPVAGDATRTAHALPPKACRPSGFRCIAASPLHAPDPKTGR